MSGETDPPRYVVVFCLEFHGWDPGGFVTWNVLHSAAGPEHTTSLNSAAELTASWPRAASEVPCLLSTAWEAPEINEKT